jgi:tetraacyldisaccharide 4'-kinase
VPVIRTFLYPLSLLYYFVISLRNYLYDKKIFKEYQSKLPVICVGNATVGGSGKTPHTIYLINLLQELGYNPVVLMRGYGGSLKGPVLVSQSHTPREVGDEACLHRKNCNVVIARYRTLGARFIEENQAIGNFIVLDDGYQHRALARDLNFLVHSPLTLKRDLNCRIAGLLPSGRLREPLNQALNRADALFLNYQNAELADASHDTTDLASIYKKDLELFTSYIKTSVLKDFFTGATVSDNIISKKPILAFCGIGSPLSFKQTIEKLFPNKNFSFVSFPDHFKFTQESINSLWSKYPDHNKICTQKDAVKLNNLNLTNKDDFFILEIETEINDRIRLISLFDKTFK